MYGNNSQFVLNKNLAYSQPNCTYVLMYKKLGENNVYQQSFQTLCSNICFLMRNSSAILDWVIYHYDGGEQWSQIA